MNDIEVSRLPRDKQVGISVWQFLLFAVVGAVGTLVHYAILFSLVEYGGQAPLTGTIIGSIAGAVVNFVLNHKFTFQSQRQLSETASRFMLIAGVSLVLNAGLMYLLTHGTRFDYRIAQLIVTVITLCFNYVTNALWTFGQKLRNRN
ncbi:GtrA family protein [Herbaspirillum sp. NPDC101397]|uniref:GtrA family protein n=1 Tax=Herbaspirillum sp. NPDC101397 TaxID=3364006 RepID=UPI00383B5280